MAIEITVSIDQFEKAMSKEVDATLPLTYGALVIENYAKLNCPVGETGELRRSITHEVEGDIAQIGTPIEYAPYVEYGTGLFAEAGDGRKDVPWCYKDAKGEWHYTSGQEPQPYIRPAATDHLDEVKEAMIKGLKKALLKQFKGAR